MKYKGSLIGRIFIVSDPASIDQWSGSIDGSFEDDFEALGPYVVYEDAGVTTFKKFTGATFVVFFTMSTKIEIFETANGLIITEGLYADQAISNPEKITFKIIDVTDYNIQVMGNQLTILNAAAAGADVQNDPENVYGFYSKVYLENSIYTIKKVDARVMANGEVVLLRGIEISHGQR